MSDNTPEEGPKIYEATWTGGDTPERYLKMGQKLGEMLSFAVSVQAMIAAGLPGKVICSAIFAYDHMQTTLALMRNERTDAEMQAKAEGRELPFDPITLKEVFVRATGALSDNVIEAYQGTMKVLSNLDEDGDGKLSARELRGGMAKMVQVFMPQSPEMQGIAESALLTGGVWEGAGAVNGALQSAASIDPESLAARVVGTMVGAGIVGPGFELKNMHDIHFVRACADAVGINPKTDAEAAAMGPLPSHGGHPAQQRESVEHRHRRTTYKNAGAGIGMGAGA